MLSVVSCDIKENEWNPTVLLYNISTHEELHKHQEYCV